VPLALDVGTIRRSPFHTVIEMIQDQDWRAHGSCSQGDPNLWFAVGALEHKRAKSICRRCPVKTECLAYAMDTPIDHGVWGGLTERERRRYRRQSSDGNWRALLSA
jgi:WhiB family redox-sensing transcriptional regulator